METSSISGKTKPERTGTAKAEEAAYFFYEIFILKLKRSFEKGAEHNPKNWRQCSDDEGKLFS